MSHSKENIYTHTARFFVKNKQLSLLLVLVSFVFGFLAFYNTPKQYDPEITLPAFRIVTTFPGATASEVEKLVTNEVEDKLIEIPGIDKISSQSFGGGQSVVTVIFKIGTGLDASKTQVIEKMQSNLNLAPLGVGAPLIQQIDPENVPVMTIAITGKDYSQEGLRAFAYDLKEKLKSVKGVTNLEVSGGKKRQLTVLINPGKLSSRGVSTQTVVQAIQGYNARFSTGYIEGKDTTIPVLVDGSIKNGNDLKKIQIGGTIDSPIYLEDVATIDDGYEVVDHAIWFTKKNEKELERSDAVYLSFAKAKGTNISDVTTSAKDELTKLKQGFVPDNISLEITRDEGQTAHEEIMTLTEHLVLAVMIVTLTLMFFLGLRVALVVATAIPLTLALVFITGYVFGNSINRITLFALIFSLGLLVDDAIVVVENIHRHFSKKEKSKTESIAHATGEVGTGVLLSTVTAVVVFAPMGLVTGMMGAYMGPIAFFAPVARLASLFVAYTLSPYLASIFLDEHAHDGHEEKPSWYEVYYNKLIEKILHNKKLQNTILVSMVTMVVVTFSFPFVGLVHFRMLPKANKEQFYVYVDLPDDASLAKTHTVATKVEEKLLTLPEVQSVESFVGAPPVADFNGLFRGSNMRSLRSQATLKVDLVYHKDRSKKSEDIVIESRELLTEEFKNEPSIRLKLVEDPPGPPVLSTFLTRIKGPDEKMREDIARDVVGMMRTIPGIVDMDSTLPTNTNNVSLTIDREKLNRFGLSVADVIQATQIALTGNAVSIAHLDTKENTNIVVRFDKGGRSRISDLSNIQMKNSSGVMVSLASVTKNTSGEIDSPILHDKREVLTMVTGETEGRAVVYVTKDLIMKLLDYKLPNAHGELVSWNLFGLTYRDNVSHEEYKVEWGGEFEMTLENFRDLGLAMLVAYLLIYIILVAQFKSFKSSGLIMTTILMGFAGVLPGFAILDFFFGVYFSATSMIGAIALGGIVVGNAILLLDFIEQRRDAGDTIESSIIEACKTRLKPIMLTSITAVLGAVVIVADPVWSGLAWALIFGLSLSTVLTLVIFPVLYYRFSGERK
jgi:multidrug efflux pump subunit AcrB